MGSYAGPFFIATINAEYKSTRHANVCELLLLKACLVVFLFFFSLAPQKLCVGWLYESLSLIDKCFSFTMPKKRIRLISPGICKHGCITSWTYHHIHCSDSECYFNHGAAAAKSLNTPWKKILDTFLDRQMCWGFSGVVASTFLKKLVVVIRKRPSLLYCRGKK